MLIKEGISMNKIHMAPLHYFTTNEVKFEVFIPFIYYL